MQREFMHWFMTVVVPILISVGSALGVARSNVAKLEHRLTKLEGENKFQSETIAEQNVRLSKHEEEQKTMFALIEQIKYLSDDVKEVRVDLKDINGKLQEVLYAH